MSLIPTTIHTAVPVLPGTNSSTPILMFPPPPPPRIEPPLYSSIIPQHKSIPISKYQHQHRKPRSQTQKITDTLTDLLIYEFILGLISLLTSHPFLREVFIWSSSLTFLTIAVWVVVGKWGFEYWSEYAYGNGNVNGHRGEVNGEGDSKLEMDLEMGIVEEWNKDGERWWWWDEKMYMAMHMGGDEGVEGKGEGDLVVII